MKNAIPYGMLAGAIAVTIGADAGVPTAVASGAESPAAGPATVSGGGHGGHSAAVNKLLAQIRRATVAYHDPEEAIDDGYQPDEVCLDAASLGAPPELGAMGVHFINEELIDDHFDPLAPEALVYEPTENGKLRLVSVEYLFAGDGPPSFAGEVEFHPFHPDLADFELHAWVWRGNPKGVFADFNPRVSCREE